MMTISELKHHIAYCKLNERDSQKKIYNSFFTQAKLICEQYTEDHDELIVIIKQGFARMFNQINNFKPVPKNWIQSFNHWLRKMMIYSAIDHIRNHYRPNLFIELNTTLITASIETKRHTNKPSTVEIEKAIRKLSPAYRTFLNLALIERFDYRDMAECLSISIETAEANLLKARNKLQELLFPEITQEYLEILQTEQYTLIGNSSTLAS